MNNKCLLTIIDLKQNFVLLERAVSTFESRFTTRVLRTTASIRKRLNAEILSQAVRDVYPKGQQILILNLCIDRDDYSKY